MPKNARGELTAIVTYTYGDELGWKDLLTACGEAEFECDTIGNPISTTGTLASTLGADNPLRYRGYVYDEETQLYYLQSRYYNPEIGRFINGDAFASTGQGLLGNNMFAYCNNNSVIYTDPNGMCIYTGYKPWLSVTLEYIDCGEIDCRTSNSYVEGDFSEELAVLRGETDIYKGHKVHKVMPGNAGFSFDDIFLPQNAGTTIYDVMHLRHEYGHTVQLDKLGAGSYVAYVVLPSVTCYALDELGVVDLQYYSLPWEFEADKLGNVSGRFYDSTYFNFFMLYTGAVSRLTNNKMNYSVGMWV